MKFLSLEPFVPSGSNYEGAKELFRELGFNIKKTDAGSFYRNTTTKPLQKIS